MDKQKTITGFSKLSKLGKIKWLVENFFKDPEIVMHELKSYWLADVQQQELLDGISENTISNYPLPLGIVPSFVLKCKTYQLPQGIEESRERSGAELVPAIHTAGEELLAAGLKAMSEFHHEADGFRGQDLVVGAFNGAGEADGFSGGGCGHDCLFIP